MREQQRYIHVHKSIILSWQVLLDVNLIPLHFPRAFR